MSKLHDMNSFKRILTSLLILNAIFCLPAIAQEVYLRKIDSLLRTEQRFGGIKIQNSTTTLINIDSTYNLPPYLSQNLIWHKKSLHFNLNGTGMLFKMDSTGKAARIDKTNYQGSNFGSVIGSYKDTIIMAGGYGFWSTSGVIKYYKDKFQEWDIFRVKQDIHFANGINAIAYQNENSGKLFLIYRKTPPEYLTINSDEQLYVQCFNLQTKQWWENEIPLNNKIANKLNDLSIIAETKWGLITNSKLGGHTILLDFEENEVYEISDDYSTDLIQTKNKLREMVSFWNDAGINLYDYQNDTLVRIPFQKDKLKSLKEPIYEASAVAQLSKNTHLPSIALTVISLVLLGLLIQEKRKKKINQTIYSEVTKEENKEINDFINSLENEEKTIIETLIENQKTHGKNTTIQELNKNLGIEKKPMKIQNNIRAAIIANINKKYGMFTSSKESLVERIRSEFDKRFFEYRLNKKLFHLLSKSLSK